MGFGIQKPMQVPQTPGLQPQQCMWCLSCTHLPVSLGSSLGWVGVSDISKPVCPRQEDGSSVPRLHVHVSLLRCWGKGCRVLLRQLQSLLPTPSKSLGFAATLTGSEPLSSAGTPFAASQLPVSLRLPTLHSCPELPLQTASHSLWPFLLSVPVPHGRIAQRQLWFPQHLLPDSLSQEVTMPRRLCPPLTPLTALSVLGLPAPCHPSAHLSPLDAAFPDTFRNAAQTFPTACSHVRLVCVSTSLPRSQVIPRVDLTASFPRGPWEFLVHQTAGPALPERALRGKQGKARSAPDVLVTKANHFQGLVPASWVLRMAIS